MKKLVFFIYIDTIEFTSIYNLKVNSSRGTNYIQGDEETLIETSAPIKKIQ